MEKPDFTAWFVLQGLIAAMHQKPFASTQNDITLQYLLPLATEASKQRLVSRLIHALPYGWQYRIGNLTTNPDRLRHFYLRKQEIEKQTRHLLESDDITQVIVLGAGLDVLTMCLANEFPQVRFIEIDLPTSQQFKKHAFKARQIIPPENIEFIEGDLRNPLADILRQSNTYNPKEKTLWIAEGLLMFIPEESVKRMFGEIAELSAKDSSFIFTTLPVKKATSKFGHALQSFYLNKENCPLQWTISYENVEIFIHSANLKIGHQIHYTELHKDYTNETNTKDQAVGESIHIAIT